MKDAGKSFGKLPWWGKSIVIFFSLLLVPYIPYIFGAIVIYFANKKIKDKGAKYIAIGLTIVIALSMGNAWAKEFSNKQEEKTVQVVVTATPTAVQQEETKLSPTSSPTPTLTSAPTSTPILPTPTNVVYYYPTSTPAPAVQYVAPASSNSGYSCNCSKTCPYMSCDEAQYQLNVCGCGQRDADNDGIACDAQC